MQKTAFLIVILVSFLVPSVSTATIIDYTLTRIGGSTYRYDYSVTNDGSLGAGTNVKLFDIAFDPAKYDESSLKIVSPGNLAANWQQSILASAPGVPADYDVLALSGGIRGKQAGFAVQFDWIGGPAGPAPQTFAIYDPVKFNVLEKGQCRPCPVPAPGPVGLLLSGLAALIPVGGRFRRI